MNSFMPWVGGKKALRSILVSMFPVYYEKYIEVFGGGGWVLFYKPPEKFEVYNDLNSWLVNLYRCVRDKSEELMDELRYVLNSREDFYRALALLSDPDTGTDVQRAAWYYQVIRQSYGAAAASYGARPQDIRASFPLIESAHRRIAEVVIENQDFQALINHYDGEDSFFYCDPPYHGTEQYYKNIGKDGFTLTDHFRLRDCLLQIKGKFLLSYNDDDFVRELYNQPGIYLTKVSRIDSYRQKTDPGTLFPEVIISNYPPPPTQLSLFSVDDAVFSVEEAS